MLLPTLQTLFSGTPSVDFERAANSLIGNDHARFAVADGFEDSVPDYEAQMPASSSPSAKTEKLPYYDKTYLVRMRKDLPPQPSVGDYRIEKAGDPKWDYDGPGGSRLTQAYWVTTNGHTVIVTVPAEKNEKKQQETVTHIARALSRQSSATLNNVWEVRAIPVTPPRGADACVNLAVGTLNAGKSKKFVIDLYPGALDGSDDKLGDTLAHECGHTLLFNNENDRAAWNATLTADKGRTVSGYAGDNHDDRAAEVYVLWRRVRGTPSEDKFRKQFQAQFELMDKWNERAEANDVRRAA